MSQVPTPPSPKLHKNPPPLRQEPAEGGEHDKHPLNQKPRDTQGHATAANPPTWPKTLLIYSLLITGGALLMLPFFILLSNSLKTDQEISDTGRLLPGITNNWDILRRPIQAWNDFDPQWSNYAEALDMMGFWPALANTTVITTLCVLGQVISSSLIGFGFARYRFRGRKIAFAIMLATMMLPAQVTMIPVFLLFRSIGAIDSFLPLILPNLFGAPFFIFMFRQFFQQVPEELLEAARIDGASALTIYARIMLPLSMPVIAIVAIYTFMFNWNDFMAPLIYLNSPENKTLALALNSFNGQYGVQFRHLLMAASFVTMLPCIVLFFAAQRFFIDTGATSGLKG